MLGMPGDGCWLCVTLQGFTQHQHDIANSSSCSILRIYAPMVGLRKPQHLHLKVLPCKRRAKVRRTVLDSWPDLLNSGNISSPSKPSQQGQPSGEQSPLERRAVVAVDLMSLSTAISLGVQTSRNKWKHKALRTIIIKKSRHLWVNPTQKQPGQRLCGFLTGSWDSHIPTCQSVILWLLHMPGALRMFMHQVQSVTLSEPITHNTITL